MIRFRIEAIPYWPMVKAKAPNAPIGAARVVIDQLHLHAVPLGPARVHALKHAGPVLALRATRPGVHLDIGVVGIRLAGEKGRDLVLFGTLREGGQADDGIVDQRLVAFGLGHLHQLDRVVALAFDRLGR